MNEGITLYKAVLHPSTVTEDEIRQQFKELSEDEVKAQSAIRQYMQNKTALIAGSPFHKDDYHYIALLDRAEDKELSYMFEQDPFAGAYIGMREEFDRDYDSGDYCPDFMYCLNKDEVEITETLSPNQAEAVNG
jgi:hypothetical protein